MGRPRVRMESPLSRILPYTVVSQQCDWCCYWLAKYKTLERLMGRVDIRGKVLEITLESIVDKITGMDDLLTG